MRTLEQAQLAIKHALVSGASFEAFPLLLGIYEDLARLLTDTARGRDISELIDAGMSRSSARALLLRADNPWDEDIPVGHQDRILSTMKALSSSSPRARELYAEAAETARTSSERQTHRHTKELVRQENQRLGKDPWEAYRQRSFRMREADEHGGYRISGYLPPATAALLRGVLDRAFHLGRSHDDDRRTVDQRSADAFDQVLRWASAQQVESTGHAAIVVSVTEDDEFDLEARFGSNVGVDLNLFELAMLSGDKLVDYIAVHTHNGALASLYSANRSATFLQRIGLIARDLVCQHPGCDVRASRCDAHHVIPWYRNGLTDIGNLVWLCRAHHGCNDDTHEKQHMEMEDGMPVWVDKNGNRRRNDSPAARKAGGRRLQNIVKS